MPTDPIIQLIREAFADVRKEDGIGPREAQAYDDRVETSELEAARKADVEQQWWDIPDSFKAYSGALLSFSDQKGFLFLLPLVMTSAIDGTGDDAATSVFYHLCLRNWFPETVVRPHHGHPEYLQYLRRIRPSDVATVIGLNARQAAAVGSFFDWWVRDEKIYSCAHRDQMLETLKKTHERYMQHAAPGNYTLDYTDAIAIWDEEGRIVTDWINFKHSKS